MPELGGHEVMFEEGALASSALPGRRTSECLTAYVDVIIRRVAVNEPVQEERVEGKSPVRRRGMEGVPFPFSPVVQGSDGGLILVEIVFQLAWVVSQRGDEERGGEDDGPAGEAEQHLDGGRLPVEFDTVCIKSSTIPCWDGWGGATRQRTEPLGIDPATTIKRKTTKKKTSESGKGKKIERQRGGEGGKGGLEQPDHHYLPPSLLHRHG